MNQHLRAANIRGKLEGRAFDPGFTPPPTTAEKRAYDAASRHLKLTELEYGDCKFPVAGEGTAHLFCGAPAAFGESYCPHHRHRAIGGLWNPSKVVAP